MFASGTSLNSTNVRNAIGFSAPLAHGEVFAFAAPAPVL